MGVSHLLELDGPSCMACGEVLSIEVLLCSSGKGCCLFGHGDLWVLAWERQPWMAVPLLGMFWQVEQMEMMKVIALTRCGKK